MRPWTSVPARREVRDQISFYDDGVGTSNFKLLAALGGAFGWGLKRNVLDLYRYASRNYRKGDQIYAFGFSRGAFTIRVVVALIASQGLVSSDDESELNSKSIAAYRQFRKQFHPRIFGGFTRAGRWLRKGLIESRHKRYRRSDNRDAKIRFVGVWDTVAAYGGPISEITRAIDNWIYPLSMPNYKLDKEVHCARHALALDDERDAFWPLLWDQVAEERRANRARNASEKAAQAAAETASEVERKRLLDEAVQFGKDERHFRTRMKQVWFAGMHSDVGGGYPDESLSYVSLLWMMEQAADEGLRMLPTIKERYYALANSYGPMHNSRSGFGAYYRYQPRKIAAWVDPPRDKYLMLQDPEVTDRARRKPGLLDRVEVHESVIARINSGTVRYAPISLPEEFDVFPPQLEGENIAQPVVGGEHAGSTGPSEPLISPETRAFLKNGAGARFQCQENLWDYVWRRRIAYFLTLGASLWLVALPFFHPFQSAEQICSDSRCVLRSLIRPAKAIVPGFADAWIEAIARYPITAIGLVVAIWALLKWSTSIEATISDKSYRLWRRVLDGHQGEPDDRVPSRLRRFRENVTYQTLFRTFKWFALPGFFGVLMGLALLYVPTVIASQIAIQFHEADHYYCRSGDQSRLRIFDRATFDFDTRQACRRPALMLEKGQVYEIVFQLPVTDKGEPVGWWDDDSVSKPGSLTRVPASGFFQLLGVPMRRVIEASYLQPLVQTADIKSEASSGRVHITKLVLKPDEEWPELYRVRFRASKQRNTSLHLFPNEAYVPFLGRNLYDNNCGTARVVITKVARRGKGFPLMDKPGNPVKVPRCALQKLKLQTSPASQEAQAS